MSLRGRGERRVLPHISALALFAAVTIVSALAARGPAHVVASEPVAETVIVRYDWGQSVQAQGLDGTSPSLEEQGYRQVRVPPGKTAAQFLAELRADPRVISAEPDVPVYAAAVPNDPYYLQNQALYLERIGAPGAWDIATGNNVVTVAVLDSGTDTAHEEFAGRLWENSKDAANDGVDADGNGCVNDRYGCRFLDLTPERRAACGYSSSAATGDIRDDHGRPGTDRHSHGTLVAGIIGAAGNNNRGITGVAWNVRIMTVKVLDCGVGGAEPQGEMFNVARGIDYARKMGANIISLSLASRDASGDRPFLRDAIAAAAAQGVIIVAAAGNHSPGATNVAPGYPAAYTEYPNVIAVGASDPAGNWATYSNYGAAVDFAAPGIGIVGTTRSDLGLANPYGVADQGTSFATPLVTGMFALMMARNSRLQMTDYIQIARDAASPAAQAPHGQPWAGAGIINLSRAVGRVPLTMTGSALRDWKDVPVGTEIKAVVGGVVCASAVSTAFGPVSRYNLRVKADLEQTGCGLPGRQVQISIGGVPAVPALAWPGRNEDAGVANRDITTVTPSPGALVVQQLNGGWSNIAHLDAGAPMPAALNAFPNTWTGALKWDPLKAFLESKGAFRRFYRSTPAYVNDLPSLATYDAIWVDGSTGNVASGNPNPPPGRTIQLERGWNNVTWTGASAAVSEALAQLDGKYSQVLQYDNPTRAWLSYLPGQPRYLNDFGGLFKLKVYWIYVTTPASLTMP